MILPPTSRLALAGAAGLLLTVLATSQAHEAHHPPPASASAAAVRVRLVDVPLTTHENRPYRLAEAARNSQLVVIGFAYTNCTSFCPLTSALLARVHEKSREQPGRPVQILTITVDPDRDTPERLAAQARLHAGSPQWLWLTGTRNNVHATLRGLGAYTPNYEDHPAMLLVGDPQRGQWIRLNGLPDPELVAEQLARLHATR